MHLVTLEILRPTLNVRRRGRFNDNTMKTTTHTNPVWAALELHGMIPPHPDSKNAIAGDLDALVRDIHALAVENQTTNYGVPSKDEIRRRLLAGETVAEIAGTP